MRIDEAVKHMTKQYLGRIQESFTKDLGPQDEDEIRDYIVRNSDELARPENVDRRIDLFEVDHSERICTYFVLKTLINTPDCAISQRELTERVQEREQAKIDEADQEDALKYVESRSAEILREVLQVAYEDDQLSRDEYRLIHRLREKLGVSREQQRLIEAQLDVFPKKDGAPHTYDEINAALLFLQRRGVVFYCNHEPQGKNIVVPEELQEGIKRVLDIELSDNARQLLWKNLTKKNLKEVLRENNFPVYGNKDELVDRLMATEIRPTEGLDELMADDLYDICNSLPGVTVSGTKADKIQRIVNHFDNLLIRELDEEASQAEQYYEYFVELAERDRENLLANDVISKDLDINNAFEVATRHLFQEKFNVELLPMDGSDHPDGMAQFDDGSLFMWDNKSKADIYTFPNSHLKQFKRYIRDTTETRVSCFMIVVPEASEEAESNCIRLKHDTSHDADISIVAAEDLKWAAENWTDYTSADSFDLSVFDHTGILKRAKIQQMMDVVL